MLRQIVVELNLDGVTIDDLKVEIKTIRTHKASLAIKTPSKKIFKTLFYNEKLYELLENTNA